MLTAGVIVATVVSVVLVKYAFDVFLIVVLFACLAFVLHAGSQVIADSELLSPAWVVITVLIIATGVWLLVPSDTLQKALQFERFLPQRVMAFLEWSAERGWAQRALDSSQPAGGAGAGPGAGPGSVGASGSLGSSLGAPAPSRAAPSRGITVTVAAAQPTVRAGQPLVLMATVMFSRPPAGDASRTVRFLVGGLRIGTASLELSGNTGTARFTTTTLMMGTYEITASYAGPGFLFGTVTSQPVTVTVTQ